MGKQGDATDRSSFPFWQHLDPQFTSLLFPIPWGEEVLGNPVEAWAWSEDRGQGWGLPRGEGGEWAALEKNAGGRGGEPQPPGKPCSLAKLGLDFLSPL